MSFLGDITWSFAENNGGRDAGINDPGVETFRGNFSHYLARELIQNSLDARLDSNKPVRVAFRLEEVNRGEIPDLAGLTTAIQRCQEYWHTQQKTVNVLERALQALNVRKVRCLCISDYNTRGVMGNDSDRNGDWYNLVRCAGSSAKAHGEGGSFGIGKNAPFAASLARTVFYSTRTSRTRVAFQGVALLATHENAHGATLQPSGFLGLPNGAAVRDPDVIPERFLRKEMGTDIWIIGYPESPNWQEDLMFSVLDSFWPAIELGHLIAEVGGVPVSKINLEKHLAEYSSKEDFTGHMYFDAYSSPDLFETMNLPELGECSLYLSSKEEFSTKRVEMVRKTGMVITKRQFRSPMPFAGVFICANDAGNARLREMEPPRHDEWSPDYPEKGASRKIYEAIGTAIRAAIKNLLPAMDAEALTIPGLERFLPDIDSDSATAVWGDNGQQREGSDGQVIESAKLKPISLKRNSLSVFEEGDGQSSGTEEDEEPGPAAGAANGERESERAAQRNADGASGRGEDRKPREIIPIRYRSFCADPSIGKYVATLHAGRNADSATVSAYAVGEDQKSLVPIARARKSTGGDLPIVHGSIGPIPLTTDAIEIEFVTSDPGRYALEITANET